MIGSFISVLVFVNALNKQSGCTLNTPVASKLSVFNQKKSPAFLLELSSYIFYVSHTLRKIERAEI